MTKSILFIGGIVTIAILLGSYFLLVPGGTSSPDVKEVSYTINSPDRPKAQIMSTIADLGEMKVSQQKEALFIVQNIGQKPLQLSKISSSCGCTVVKILYEGKESGEFGMHAIGNAIFEVAPQKEAQIKVIYRPYVMPVYGKVDREAYVSTNDPENPKLVFKVEAFVK